MISRNESRDNWLIKCLKSFLVVNLAEIFLECGIKDSSSILSIISKLIPTVRKLSRIKFLVNRYFGQTLWFHCPIYFKSMDFASTIVLFVSTWCLLIHFKRAMNRLLTLGGRFQWLQANLRSVKKRMARISKILNFRNIYWVKILALGVKMSLPIIDDQIQSVFPSTRLYEG